MFASFVYLSLTALSAASAQPLSCARLLTPALQQHLVSKGLSVRELAYTTALLARVDHVKKNFVTTPDPFKVLLVQPLYSAPLVFDEEGREALYPTEDRHWKLSVGSKTIAFGSDGAWRFNTEKLGELAMEPFLKTHENAIRQLLKEGFSESAWRGASVTPFAWNSAPGWLLGIVRDQEIRYFFFNEDPDRYWNAEVVLENFTPNQHYLRVGPSLIAKTLANRFPNQRAGIVEFEANFASWSLNDDAGFRRLVELRPDLVERLMVGAHLDPVSFGKCVVESTAAVDVEHEERKYLLLALTTKRPQLFTALVDETATMDQTQIHFAHPRVLRADDGRHFRASYAYGQWSVDQIIPGDVFERLLHSAADVR